MTCRRRWWGATLLLGIIILSGSRSIRISRVSVPKTLEVGSGGELDCSWEEENDRMYSIQWYQGDREFYRYTPTSSDPIQVFDPPTLDVDREKSWGGSVHIANVSLAAEGPFHCEVSADGPYFHTASDTAKLNVVSLPEGLPVIKGMKMQYSPTDWVNLTCISNKSKPPPDLSFNLNSQPPPPEWLTEQVNQMDQQGLVTSSRTLRFPLHQQLLMRGQARVTCLANITGFYHERSHEVISTGPNSEAFSLATPVTGGNAKACYTVVASTLLGLLLRHICLLDV